MTTTSPSQAAKIQKDENWVYEDDKGEIFNETATEVVQFSTTSGDAIAVIKVDTTRKLEYQLSDYELYYSKNNYNISITSSIESKDDGELWLTQEGGLPLFSSSKFVGKLSFNMNGTLFEYEINKSPTWFILGSPSTAFATAESEGYEVFSEYLDSTIRTEEGFILSTNQELNDDTRNYTRTRTEFELSVDDPKNSFSAQIVHGISTTNIGFNLNGSRMDEKFDNENIPSDTIQFRLFSDALRLTWEEGQKLPTYIAQTEPEIVLNSRIKLNKIDQNIVEYFLLTDDQTQADDPTQTDDQTQTERLKIRILPGLFTVMILIHSLRKRNRN